MFVGTNHDEATVLVDIKPDATMADLKAMFENYFPNNPDQVEFMCSHVCILLGWRDLNRVR